MTRRGSVERARRPSVGVTVPQNDLETGRLLTLDELGAYSGRAEALGFDSIWVMDHVWIRRGGSLVGGHHPMVALGYIAAVTSSIRLGTLVVCNSFRSPAELGRQATAVADASRGRFTLGIGPGWHQPEYDAFGIPFDHRVGRLAETLAVLPRLLHGETVSFEGEFLQLREASLLTSGARPPIWVAARGERTIGLAYRHADGWNSAWHAADATAFGQEVKRVEAGLVAAGRSRAAFETSVGVLALPCVADEREVVVERARGLIPAPSDGDAPAPADLAVIGDAASLAAVIKAYAAAGADHVILGLSTSPFALFDPQRLDRAAEALPLLGPGRTG